MLRRKGGHTIILGDYDGILVISHPGASGGNQWDGRRGRVKLVQWLLGALVTYIPSVAYKHSSVSEFLIEVTMVADSRTSNASDAVTVNISMIYLNHCSRILRNVVGPVNCQLWIGLFDC